MNEFGEHDHIIDFVVELQDRVERLERALSHTINTTSARMAELEERIATLAGGGQRSHGEGKSMQSRPSKGNDESL
ncbi:MAG: hypothetical protein QOH49_2001 [Acidobacteriota bacterium]|jgi:hypothetical protein|nr:hypothetical protein [Acidobacteriota bacterium]